MKKALITGAGGFVGTHLAKELEDNGYQVIKSDRQTRNDCPTRLDVTDYEQVRSVILSTTPQYIFHLAAIAFVPASWQDPNMVMRINLEGSLNLFNAVRSVGIDPVIQIAGSSEEYGLVYPDEIPIKETNPLRPLSPYAVSKIAMGYLAYQYHKTYGMKIVRTRAFNHEGYGRGEMYMTSTFAKQIVEIEAGLKDTLYHGDLSSIRDITDVRDTVRAYRLAVETFGEKDYGEPFNIGTGKGYAANEVLSTLSKLSKIKIFTKEDPKRLRPSDVKVLICDSTKFREKTGWEPKYPIEETLSEALRYWRERISNEKTNQSTG